MNEEFEFVGDGWCRSKCYENGHDCRINAYYKKDSNFDECKAACENESACTGFDIANSTFSVLNFCIVYGNISSVNVAKWANYSNWTPLPRTTYGYKGFEIDSSTGHPGIRCFKRLYEDQNDGKFSM